MYDVLGVLTIDELIQIRDAHVSEYDTDEFGHPAPRCVHCTILPPFSSPARFYGAFKKVRHPCPTVRLVEVVLSAKYENGDT